MLIKSNGIVTTKANVYIMVLSSVVDGHLRRISIRADGKVETDGIEPGSEAAIFWRLVQDCYPAAWALAEVRNR